MIPFLDRLRRKETVGMDCGSAGIKFVRIRREKGNGSIVSQWFYPGPVFGEGEEGDRAISSLRDFLKSNFLAGAPVACNIEEASLKIRKVELPQMPEADLKEAVRWLMRDAVEGLLGDYVVRHSLIEEIPGAEPKRLSLLAYAIKKGAVRSQMDFLRRLSLNPILIEPTSVSLVALFEQVHGWTKGEFYGLIDLGESRSTFLALGEGRLYFSRPLPNISCRNLRETSPASFMTQIAVETQRSIDAFSVMFRREGIRSLFLCGGGAELVGLTEYLNKNLAVPTFILDPSEKFPMRAGPAHLYDVALGLALYGYTS